MTEPLSPPAPKDPLRNGRAGLVPPGLRSRAAKEMATYAAQGRFVLQECTACATATYPPRDRCPCCWGTLDWRDQPTEALVLAETTIRHSADGYFRSHMPWRIGTVQLSAGPTAIVHLHGDVAVGDKVRMTLRTDRGGNPALFAMPAKDTANMQDDPQLRSFTANPKNRRILVTDGRGPVGQAVARALLQAGARTVFLGDAEPLMRYPGKDEIEKLPGIEPVSLRLTDTASVQKLAAQLGGRVDIVVNTADYTRAGGVAFGGKLSDLQAGFDLGVAGLMRLAQAFGPALGARSDDGTHPAAAFVDIAPVAGISGQSGYATAAAVASARLSLVAALRGEMQKTGIRVISVLTGPPDDDWHQRLPPPKATPAQIAKAVTHALTEGQEIVCADDIARDTFARWLKNPLLTLREENE